MATSDTQSVATTPSIAQPEVIDWLIAGDPAIRWQTMRDLQGLPEAAYSQEQKRAEVEGWGAELLSRQDPDGRWGAGIYSPKWKSTTFTLLSLVGIGIPRECGAAELGTRLVIDSMLGKSCDSEFKSRLAALDRCIVGMVLQLGVYFGVDDSQLEAIVENLLSEKMPDGGWNCRRHRKPYPRHSSFHTTFNVLEGLREYLELRDSSFASEVRSAENDALEFMLQHKLFRSDNTGEIIRESFTRFVYPHRWHYDVLRGLDYFARAGFAHDARLQDAIDLLLSRQDPQGKWPNSAQYAGTVFFNMEKAGLPSRWNTLRALRVLRWWNSCSAA